MFKIDSLSCGVIVQVAWSNHVCYTHLTTVLILPSIQRMVTRLDFNVIFSELDVSTLLFACATCKQWHAVVQYILQCKHKWKLWAWGSTYNYKYVEYYNTTRYTMRHNTLGWSTKHLCSWENMRKDNNKRNLIQQAPIPKDLHMFWKVIEGMKRIKIGIFYKEIIGPST